MPFGYQEQFVKVSVEEHHLVIIKGAGLLCTKYLSSLKNFLYKSQYQLTTATMGPSTAHCKLH